MKKKEKNLRLANALKEFRIKKQWTQQEMADRVGFSRPVLSFLENGIQPPKMQHIIALKEKVGLDISEYIYNEDKATIPNSVSDSAPYYGSPKDLPEDIGQFMIHMNTMREVRKDIHIAANLIDQLRKSEENLTYNARKILDQVSNILISAQLQL